MQSLYEGALLIIGGEKYGFKKSIYADDCRQ